MRAGARSLVTSDHAGYSILLDRRVCYPNGIRPSDQLKVEVVGFPGAVASVIWRTTSVNKRAEVGRLSTSSTKRQPVGSRILVVPQRTKFISSSETKRYETPHNAAINAQPKAGLRFGSHL